MHGIMTSSRGYVLMVVVALLSTNCRRDGGAERDVSSELNAAVRQASAGHKEAAMTSVVPDAWEQVCVFPAYGWPDYVNRQLGFDWPGGSSSKTNVQDRYQLVVFVHLR